MAHKNIKNLIESELNVDFQQQKESSGKKDYINNLIDKFVLGEHVDNEINDIPEDNIKSILDDIEDEITEGIDYDSFEDDISENEIIGMMINHIVESDHEKSVEKMVDNIEKKSGKKLSPEKRNELKNKFMSHIKK